ncbi:nuclear transport factor 2 family protein [Nitratireductor soli]|uniref:nuclear transport factor 2 family protein n=1 Tax=Nitratireductor soli TaxID=1670619 RepID=UPI00065DEC83|nr:nuclear transport factor 2 family protein [Nitratireductor soli]
MITSEITQTLEEYFNVLQTQDLAIFDRVFHPESVLYSSQDGETVVRPIADYREIVVNRESPQSRNCKTHNEILLIDVMSPEMAMAKVRLRLYDNMMVDYLCLLKVDGKWTIASKLFHKEGAA